MKGRTLPGRQLQTWSQHRAAESHLRLRHRWNARSRHRRAGRGQRCRRLRVAGRRVSLEVAESNCWLPRNPGAEHHVARIQAAMPSGWIRQPKLACHGKCDARYHTVQGGVFIEASQTTNLVDHNFLWNINGEGVRLRIPATPSSRTTSSDAFRGAGVPSGHDRSLGGRKLTSTGNQIVNNVVVDQGKPIFLRTPATWRITTLRVHPGWPDSHEGRREHSVAIQGTSRSTKAACCFPGNPSSLPTRRS